ncbi:MAG: YlmC/YmxH family sporulation protein [Peptococcaceae bacterium]|jgi:YlmC/YmxH family sporulation protein|nr:YlmC/YmxH family sporulation protein [Peptococcaceae bacterium]
MRLSEFVGKKIINLSDGDILGTVGDSDLMIDAEDGTIQSLLIPYRGGNRLLTRGEKKEIAIPWQSIRKIGAEVLVVEVNDLYRERAW